MQRYAGTRKTSQRTQKRNRATRESNIRNCLSSGGKRKSGACTHLSPDKLRDPVLGRPIHRVRLVALRDEDVVDSAGETRGERPCMRISDDWNGDSSERLQRRKGVWEKRRGHTVRSRRGPLPVTNPRTLRLCGPEDCPTARCHTQRQQRRGKSSTPYCDEEQVRLENGYKGWLVRRRCQTPSLLTHRIVFVNVLFMSFVRQD